MRSHREIVDQYTMLEGKALLEAVLSELPGKIALVSSFGADSAVLLHMISEIDLETPVLFLDTKKLFPETLDYRDRLIDHLKLEYVRTLYPFDEDEATHDPEGDLWERDNDLCCHFRKTLPLDRALMGFSGWITGRKRFHGGARANLPSLEIDGSKIKINPLINWVGDDVEAYLKKNKLPRHPLVKEGYPSIGCAPFGCTRPVKPGEDVRAGRWANDSKLECGIHWTADGKPIRIDEAATKLAWEAKDPSER